MASNAPYDAQASTNYKEAFALFDKRGNQRVQLDSLKFLQSVGALKQ